jgi:3-hydroxy acid dehydrogenase/malonic semialdehyde reductase
MGIFCFFKWLFYIFSGVVVLGFIALLVFPLFDQRVPINQQTKTCLVTDAASGIGRALSAEMVKQGWKVIGVGLNAQLLEEVKQQLGSGKFIPYVCDVSNHEAVHEASDDMKARGLKPTLFFLNAGIRMRDEKGKIITTDYQKVFAVNYFGVIAWIEHWLPMVKQWGGGTFVATSSIAALFDPAPGGSAYGASKAALINSFRSLRLQYLNDKIGFSVVLPGMVDTKMGAPIGLVPFVHSAADEARYIIAQTFKGRKQIEPSCFWSTFVRLARMLPDPLSSKMFCGFVSLFSKK